MGILISILYLLSSVIVTIRFQKYISKKATTNIPLFDHCHSDSNLWITEYYTVADIFMIIYWVLLIFLYNDFLKDLLYILGTLYYLRTLLFTITVLPKCGKMADKDCSRTVSKIIFDYITLQDKHTGFNNDLLFSGHTMFSTLFSLYVTRNRLVFDIPLYLIFLIWILNIFLSLLNIFSRCHYSIDIIVAYIATIFVFQNYYSLGSNII